MRKYKVLQITNFLDMSGQQETVLATAAYMDPDRFESHLASNMSGSDTRKLDTVLARRAREIPHIHLHDLPHVRIMPAPLMDLWTLFDIYRLIRRERFDIVQTQATKVALLGRLAAKAAGAPIIIHYAHGWPFQFTLIPAAARNVFMFLEKVAAKATDYFIACDHTLQDAALEHRLARPDQIAVIRSGMDLERFLNVRVNGVLPNAAQLRQSLGLPPAGPIVGTVMIFEPKKSPESIVRIAPEIIKAVPDAHFLLVGDGEQMPLVRQLVEELGLQERVALTGLRQDVPELMALMDVFVHPAWFDVLPRAIVQAQATGAPVVATHVGAIHEVVRDGVTGFLVPPRDLAALTAPVIRLLQDAELRGRLGRAARESTSSAFTVEAMVREIERVYDQLIEAKLERGQTAHVNPSVSSS